MATIFPREEKAEMLFDKILANPEACRRLKRTFYDAIDSGDEFVTENLPAKQFTAALFDAYENKDLTAFLMAVCQNSMFDLLRNAFLIPFKFNADGHTNPIFLTDEEGKLLENLPIHVKEKEYEKFLENEMRKDSIENSKKTFHIYFKDSLTGIEKDFKYKIFEKVKGFEDFYLKEIASELDLDRKIVTDEFKNTKFPKQEYKEIYKKNDELTITAEDTAI